MGHRDPAESAARTQLARELLDVVIETWSGIDQPRRIAPENPGVRSAERERARVAGTDPDDVVLEQLEPHGGSMADA